MEKVPLGLLHVFNLVFHTTCLVLNYIWELSKFLFIKHSLGLQLILKSLHGLPQIIHSVL